MAHLDPLAPREFQQTLIHSVAENGVTVLLSSHIIADLERFCDYLVLLVASHVQIAEDIEHLTRTHKLVIGPQERITSLEKNHTIIHANYAARQSQLLVQTHGTILDPAWQVKEIPLEEIILGYMSQYYNEKAPLSQDIQEVL